jgi:putative spermidine/putrescine transport system permease protein
VVVGIAAIFFAVPLVAMLDFSTRTLAGSRTGKAWATLVDFGTLSTAYTPLWDGLQTSLILVVLTVLIMVLLLVPTMTWIRLRVPGLRRPMEFICLLPLTIPAIVLVVGLAPIYRGLSALFSTSAVWLCLAYVILVLPFAYRALDAGLAAIDVRTLAEAARGLGASWLTVLWRIILPNVRGAVLSACFLSVALVLGEFTIASLLSRNNLQTGVLSISATDPRLAVAISLVLLLFGFVLLLGFSLLARGNRDREGSRS